MEYAWVRLYVIFDGTFALPILSNLILYEIKLLKLSKVQACQLTSIDLIFSIKGPFSNLDLSSMQQQQIVTCMATNLNPNYSRSNLD